MANGHTLNFYDWTKQQLIQTIDLGYEGTTPLEIRFMHNPNDCQGYVGCAFFGNVYHFERKPNSDEFVASRVIDIPAKKVEGWLMPEVNALVGDILLSLDDKYLYLNCWLQGDVRQYDITDRKHPKLVGQVFLGGVTVTDLGVKVTEDKELDVIKCLFFCNNHKSIEQLKCDTFDLQRQQDPTVVKGTRLHGGPQMLQLSLDGKRLYVSSCLYSPWDKEVYPETLKSGGYIVQIDVNIETGGMAINPNFLVDFGKEPYGPTLPHEMRYPGGDCTSDIWLTEE